MKITPWAEIRKHGLWCKCRRCLWRKSSIGPGIWPEGTERVDPHNSGRFDYTRWQRTTMPCPEFECNAPMMTRFETMTFVCTNMHLFKAEDLFLRGVKI